MKRLQIVATKPYFRKHSVELNVSFVIKGNWINSKQRCHLFVSIRGLRCGDHFWSSWNWKEIRKNKVSNLQVTLLESKSKNLLWIQSHTHTTSWELWKHPDPAPGGRPIFFKPKWPKESKNGFKTISCRRYPIVFFSKNCFRCKKFIKKIGRFVDFRIFMAIYMDKLDQFQKI